MINEFVFIAGLFVSGYALNSLLCSKLPKWVSITTAFFTGCINWVIICALYWLVASSINLRVVSIAVIIESIVFITITIIKKKLFPIHWKTLLFPMLYTILFCGFDILFLKFNITHATRDSLSYILLGKEMEFHGISELIWGAPGSIGYFTSLMQAPSRFLGIDYLYSFESIFSATFIMFFISAAYFYFSRNIGKVYALLFSVVMIAFMYSSKIMQYMFSYVISNHMSGVFLFISLFCYYAYFKNKNEKSWLALGAVFVMGFCLLRIDTPVIAMVLLILLSKFLEVSYKDSIRYVIPCVLFALFVDSSYLILYSVSPEKSLLDLSNIIALITIELMTIFYFVLGKNILFEKYIKRNIHIILSILFLLFLIFAFSTKFTHMTRSLVANISSSFITGGWGSTWLIILLWYVFYLDKCTNGFLAFLKYFIPSHYLVMLLLTNFSGSFHERWSGSGNRMFVQFFFVCVFFMTISLIQSMEGKSTASNSFRVIECKDVPPEPQQES